MIKKIINHKIFKTFLSIIPLISLALTTISTNYYYFFDNSYQNIYTLISYMFGFSIISLPSHFYLVYKYNFCKYSKIAVWSILFYIVINIFYFFVEVCGFKVGWHMEIFEAISLLIMFTYSMILYVTRNKKNE